MSEDHKTLWDMYDTIPDDEKGKFLSEEWVREEERALQWMVDTNKHHDARVVEYTERAKRMLDKYNETGEDSFLELAEACASEARQAKQDKYSIADIRKQRERVQWQRKKLNQMSTEQRQSSSP